MYNDISIAPYMFDSIRRVMKKLTNASLRESSWLYLDTTEQLQDI
jgi:hypothetical protein